MIPVQRAFWLLIVLSFGHGYGGQRMISHLSSTDGGFTPGVVIANTSGVDGLRVTLRPYTITGEALPEVTGTIHAGVTRYVTPTMLFGREDVTHFVIEGDEGVVVSTTYQAVAAGGTPVHVHESSEQSQNWRVYPGDWSAVWDGLALVNTGEAAAQVTIVQKDAIGQIIASQETLTIQPFAKYLTVLGEHFSAASNSHFEIAADQALAVTALRGSYDNRYLWANVPVAQAEVVDVSASAQFQVRVTDGVKYAEGLTHSDWNTPDGTPMDLLLDVYEPIGAVGPRPAVVFIHGGGFTGGNRKGNGAVSFGNHMAARGFVCFSIDYRLAGDRGTIPQTYRDYIVANTVDPSELDPGLATYTAGRDAKAAIRWVRANATTYNINTQYISVAGGSAGALTAIALGVSNPQDYRDELTLAEDPTLATTHLDQDASVRAIIDYWGSPNMPLALADAYGRESLFDAGDPPLAIIHGTADQSVPYAYGLELDALYEASGAYRELYPLVGEGHGAWTATYEGSTMNDLAFDFMVRMQQLSVSP